MTKADKKSTAVAEVKQGAVVDHEALAGFADFAQQGLKNLSKDDLAIPFLMILQSGSPQCKRSDGAYVEGAAEGMLFNTVTKEVIDPNARDVYVIPCSYDRAFVEWKLRENGGGFVKQHPADPAILNGTTRDEKGRDILQNGNQINDTRSFYVMMLDEDGTPSPAFITMTSTQIKKSKQWLMQQNLLKLKGPNGAYTPPMFASKWQVTTVPEQNDKGSWMGWAFEHAGYLKGPQDPVFVAAKAFADSVAAGAVKADLSKVDDPFPPAREAAPGDGTDDDVQF